MPWSSIAPSGPQPPLSPAEMDLLVARTGLTLNPGQMADLVLAWRQLAPMIAAIPRETAPADDQAFVFRLPDPSAPPALRKTAASRKNAGAKPATKKKAPVKKPGKPARKR
jgi:hypothetical protein